VLRLKRQRGLLQIVARDEARGSASGPECIVAGMIGARIKRTNPIAARLALTQRNLFCGG
jgi:hypothetical protein